MSRVYFLHLSDLHLRDESSDPIANTDKDIRDQVLQDVGRWRHQHAADGRIRAAGLWFAQLTEEAGCDRSRVFTVPGNHDVDRSVLVDNPRLLELQHELRTISLDKLQSRFREMLADPTDAQQLMLPLTDYNSFAQSYRCNAPLPDLSWSQLVDLGEGLWIRIIGLTTPLISDKDDGRGEEGMVLGQFQVIVREDNRMLTIVLMHHPHDWLRDGAHIMPRLGNRAQLILSGHQHVFNAAQVQPAAGEPYLLVESGALHPEDQEPGWDPRYNWIEIEYPADGNSNLAHLCVHPFRWNPGSNRFEDSPGEVNGLNLNVAVRGPIVASTSPVEVETEAISVEPINTAVDQEPFGAEDATGSGELPAPATRKPDAREVYFRYRELSETKRVKVLAELKLTVNTDTRFASEEGIDRTLREVRDRGVIDEFVTAVWTEYERKD